MEFPHRRLFLHVAVGAAALPFAPHIARAQAYPTRPVRIIVGFPAGGAADIVARVMGQWLSERLSQPFGGEVSCRPPARHSPLMLAALMIGHHFSISALTSNPSDFGVCSEGGKISIPMLSSRRRTAASAKATIPAPLSFSMMFAGVPLGANMAHQGENVRAGNPTSAAVGISGAMLNRFLAVTM